MSGSKPGERRGGRKAGVPNKATAEIRTLAREHGPDAIRELARLAERLRASKPVSPPAMRCSTGATVGRKQAS